MAFSCLAFADGLLHRNSLASPLFHIKCHMKFIIPCRNYQNELIQYFIPTCIQVRHNKVGKIYQQVHR
jgi:hypothetical protein